MAGFLAMGGYAQWVWTAFGLTLIVLTGNVIAARRRYRQSVQRLRMRSSAEAGRRAR